MRGLNVVQWLGGTPAARRSITGLLLHRDLLCRLPVRGLWVLSQLPVKDSQLFVQLAPGFHEFVEPCLSLGVGGAVMRRRL
jgi:hypothetical protein